MSDENFLSSILKCNLNGSPIISSLTCKEVFLFFGMPPHYRGAGLLPLGNFQKAGLNPGVQGESEAGAKLKNEGEGVTLSCQRLAEFQALICKS